MSGKRSGPGALAGAAEAGIECSERQFDTRSYNPQQSPRAQRRSAISRELRRVEQQPERGNKRHFVWNIRPQVLIRRSLEAGFLVPLTRRVPSRSRRR